jgi:hypothetical protein
MTYRVILHYEMSDDVTEYLENEGYHFIFPGQMADAIKARKKFYYWQVAEGNSDYDELLVSDSATAIILKLKYGGKV